MNWGKIFSGILFSCSSNNDLKYFAFSDPTFILILFSKILFSSSIILDVNREDWAFWSYICSWLWKSARLFSAFESNANHSFDLIVSNPPYVDATDLAKMPDEYSHEPALALASGDDGLDFTRRLLCQAADYLTEQGGFGCRGG